MFQSEKKPPIVERRVPTREQNVQYYKYSLQIQDAVKSFDLKALDVISEAVVSDSTFEMDERQQISERIKKEKIGVIISQYVRLGNVPLLHSVEDLIERSSMSGFEKKVYMLKIIDGIVRVELHDAILRDDIGIMREYQKKVFLDDAIDNKKREYLFDAVEELIKRIQKKNEKTEKRKTISDADFVYKDRYITDSSSLPLVDFTDERRNILDSAKPTFPLDVEGIVAKFKLYDFDKLQQFRERVNRDEYPMYKEQLLHIISAFQHEFSREFSEERERGKVREKWHMVFQKTVRKYRTERRKPGAHIRNVNVGALLEFNIMSKAIAKDPEISLEDKEHLFRKIRSYLEKYPLESEPLVSTEMKDLPPVSDSQSYVQKLLRERRMRLNSQI